MFVIWCGTIVFGINLVFVAVIVFGRVVPSCRRWSDETWCSFFELVKSLTTVILRGCILIETIMEMNLLRSNLCTITDLFDLIFFQNAIFPSDIWCVLDIS